MTNDEELAKRLEESTKRYEEAKKKFSTAYSQKLLETPCARSTLLTCIPSGIGAGLITYLLTSQPLKAVHGSFITLFGVGSYYFITCYNDYKKKLKENKEVGEIMDLIVKYRGTEMEENLKREYIDRIKKMDDKSKFI